VYTGSGLLNNRLYAINGIPAGVIVNNNNGNLICVFYHTDQASILGRPILEKRWPNAGVKIRYRNQFILKEKECSAYLFPFA
jgi:hypothetical protein